MNSGRTNLMIAVVAAVLLPAVGAQAVVRYVALDGSGADGKSWGTAYKTIQAALNDAAMVGGSEIRVKRGVYTITTPITVKKAVSILGGYSGVGDARSWTVNQTTVNGGDKATHCFLVTANATIDGFGILSSYGVGNNSNGGGVNITKCSPTISNCLFKYNHSAGSGGALSTFLANSTKVLNCTFTDNTATVCGGAIVNENSNGVVISKCTFKFNSCGDSGAGIFNIESAAKISDCLFQENDASTETVGVAGGVGNENSSSTITNCVFVGNRAPYGPGVFNYQSNATIEGCLFAHCDSTALSGGGVYNMGGAPVIRSCLFQENSVRDQGGGLMSDGAGGKVINCVFWKNYGAFGGGAVYIGAPQAGKTFNLQFINCTLYENGTNWRGGGVCSEATPSTFLNCIIWENRADDANPGVYSYAGWNAGQPDIRYSDVQGESLYPGAGNLRTEPYLMDPSEGDFGLEFDSLLIDAGYNTAVVGIDKDYEDAPRVVDGDGKSGAVVDIGACELQGIPDHLTDGEIMTATVYSNPDDTSPTYVFSTVYEIPSDTDTSSGNVETHHYVDGKAHIWEYRVSADNSAALAAYGHGTYRVTAHYRNGTQATTNIAYVQPGTSSAIPQPTQKPKVKSPGYNAVVGSPVKFTWEACTDSAANGVYLTITQANPVKDVVSEKLDKSATSSPAYVLAETAYEAELGFVRLYKVNSSDGTPFQCGKAVLVGHQFSIPYTAVHRFWSPVTGAHFYTVSEKEKQRLLDDYAWYWVYEGVAFSAWSSDSDSYLLPVYRFYSGRVHYYTISESERSMLVNQYSAIWKAEGIAFYAYPEGLEPAGARAVYHFWNSYNDAHFFTMDDEEVNRLFNEYSDVFTYEGVAFYAFAP
ncbi:MAG: hypothetical protein MUC88_13015 [Planctomycetes bacterium]|nr:hypothetical protein [Planctomycetota bacterium]